MLVITRKRGADQAQPAKHPAKNIPKNNLKKITLAFWPNSFISKPNSRGVRILAITLAFQAREAGSIPARRSNFQVSRSVDRGATDCFQTINVLEQEFDVLWCG